MLCYAIRDDGKDDKDYHFNNLRAPTSTDNSRVQYNTISIQFGFNYIQQQTLADVRYPCLRGFKQCQISYTRAFRQVRLFPSLIITYMLT